MSQKKPYLSIVSPVYQADGIIDELVARILKNLTPIADDFEIILVDDGSLDLSWSKIVENCEKDQRIKGIQLSRNFGQHSAITAGIESALGEWVVVMDCDLQDRPEEIFPLYKKAKEGFDIVLASRVKRKDRLHKRFFSALFYGILSKLSGTRYDHTTANFGIYHRNVIQSILTMQESIRFFPAMVNWVGFRKAIISVEHAERFQGKSSYNFKRQFKLALDIMLAYSDKPLRLIVGLGVSISLIAFLFAFVMIYRAIQGQIHVLGYASLIISISFFSGIIISVLGVMGLYIGKIFEGIKKRPLYVVGKKKNVFYSLK